MAKSVKKVDRDKAARAIADFLDALGVDRNDPNVVGTPERVAKAWADQLLDGQHKNPVRTIGARLPATGDGPVLATEIPFLSMCPHHLLPLTGMAHIAFLPCEKVPGFGALPRLVDACAHRLILQEDLSQMIVDTLMRAVDATAAVCILRAQHFCVGVTDPARRGTQFTTVAQAGPPDAAAELLRRLDVSLRS